MYTYGFYLPYDAILKIKVFDYPQGNAEAFLERLHHSAENNLKI